MTEAASNLIPRVLRVELIFSAGAAVLLSAAIPQLLLMDEVVVQEVMRDLLITVAAAGIVAATIAFFRLRTYRFLFRAVALGSGSVEAHEMANLSDEPAKLIRSWLAPHVAAVAWLASPWRPRVVDFPTGVSAAVLAAVMVAAASLPLQVLIRSSIMRLVELAPPDVMRDVVESSERSGRARERIPRRLMTAVATPVAFVALGAALIANAHLRRADEHSREETARALARASLEPGPGVLEDAGLEDALDRAQELGFSAAVFDNPAEYRLERADDGHAVLTTPLDLGNARMDFSGSTVPVLSYGTLLIALLGVALAAVLGFSLGTAYTDDLGHAMAGLRLIGTEAVIRGHRPLVGAPRFRVVAELEWAIDRLAERFRVFAQAQERAIEAKEAATRMRGLFFASVSHDLKSPLNAILGFTELVRLEPLTSGQAESLDVIEQRGRELLALIETILDAARVEAGQLSLYIEPVNVSNLLGEAIVKAKELAATPQAEIIGEIGDDIGELPVDRVRMGRALATLIAYGVRNSQRNTLRVLATRAGDGVIRIDIEVPNPRVTYRQLKKLLTQAHSGDREHRGLALGVSLSRSVIELHGGTVRPVGRTADSTAFCVRLPRLTA